MSKNWYEWRRALWDAPEVGRAELLVGMYIWDCANQHHEAWPTVAKIGRKTRYSRKHTAKIINDLVEKGWLTKRAWDLPSGGQSWRYTLRFPANQKARKKWGLIQKNLQTQMSTHNYTNFFEPLWAEMEAADSTELTVVATDEFLVSWVEHNYRELIEENARKHGIATVSFKYRASSLV